MKRILLMDEGSFIGNSIKSYLLAQLPTGEERIQYGVATLSTLNDKWDEVDFWVCDTVIYTTEVGSSFDKEMNAEEIMRVNHELAVRAAEKCKKDRVRQFIYMSSIDVYGMMPKMGKELLIDELTPCRPKTAYAKSKYETEKRLAQLADDKFRVSIFRVPMVYGGGGGEYSLLREYAMSGKPVPAADAKRSYIHIDNLCDYIKYAIENMSSGIFCPQNPEIVTPSEFIEAIARVKNREIKRQSPIANVTSMLNAKMNQLLGGLRYAESLAPFLEQPLIGVEDSIRKTEREGYPEEYNEGEQ